MGIYILEIKFSYLNIYDKKLYGRVKIFQWLQAKSPFAFMLLCCVQRRGGIFSTLLLGAQLSSLIRNIIDFIFIYLNISLIW